MPNSKIRETKPAIKRKSVAPTASTELALKSESEATNGKGMVAASDRLFDRVGSGESTVIDTALKLAELIDDVTPLGGEGSPRRALLNGAFQLADDVAQAQLGLMRSAVHGVVFVNVDVHAFNGTDVDVNVGTNVDTLTRKRGLAAA